MKLSRNFGKLTEDVKCSFKRIVMEDYDHQGIILDLNVTFTYVHVGDDCVATQNVC